LINTNSYTKLASKHNLVELHIIDEETDEEYRNYKAPSSTI